MTKQKIVTISLGVIMVLIISTNTDLIFTVDSSRESEHDNQFVLNHITPIPNYNTDKFGITMLYPSKEDGEEWYMNMSDPANDNRFHSIIPKENILSRNPDGSWKLTSIDYSPKIRINILTSSGYDQNRIDTLDHSEIALAGFMQDHRDWKNVEMTGYIKLNSFLSDHKFQWFNRGGIHYASGPNSAPCEGVGYKGNLYFSGETRFTKEQWHVHNDFTDLKPATDSLEGRWLGYKLVVYNVESGGKVGVKLENWLDENANGTWTKVDEYLDDGGWGDQGESCNGDPDQVISWGGPVATFRWDDADDVDFAYFSIREIRSLQISREQANSYFSTEE